jgi:hypothetical protein
MPGVRPVEEARVVGGSLTNDPRTVSLVRPSSLRSDPSGGKYHHLRTKERSELSGFVSGFVSRFARPSLRSDGQGAGAFEV